MFNENKYTKWYYKIITRAQNRVIEGYVENHHIIPECLFKNRKRKGLTGVVEGNPDAAENMVKLTAREHYICHKLLTKMCNDQNKIKMLYAYRMLSIVIGGNQQRYKISSREFEKIRGLNLKGLKRSDITKAKLKVIASNRIQSVESNEKRSIKLKGRLYPRTKEHQDKITESLKGISPWNKGLTLSDEKYKIGGRKNIGRKHPESSGENNPSKRKEVREKLSQKAKSRIRITCPYCLIECQPGNYKRWHGDKCKNYF